MPSFWVSRGSACTVEGRGKMQECRSIMFSSHEHRDYIHPVGVILVCFVPVLDGFLGVLVDLLVVAIAHIARLD